MKEVTMKTCVASTGRVFLLRLAVAAGIIFSFAMIVRAGGPKCIAGSSYFDPTTTGKALTWPLGQIIYYTDQGRPERDPAQCVGEQLRCGGVRRVDFCADSGAGRDGGRLARGRRQRRERVCQWGRNHLDADGHSIDGDRRPGWHCVWL